MNYPLSGLGNPSNFLDYDYNSFDTLHSHQTGLGSQQLLQLAGEMLINAWHNQTGANQSLVYAAGSIFNTNFVANAQVAFGKDFDIAKAEAFGADVLNENYGVLPDVEFLLDSQMNSANGAYSESTNTIYINSVFLTQNAANPTAIGKVLLEEVGHFLDAYASPIDSQGDEGEILAGLVAGTSYSPSELITLKAEDDSSVFMIHGQSVSVELSTSNTAPTSLQFNLDKTNLKTTDTLSINGGWVYDANGATDLSRVDFWIKRSNGTFVDVADATSFTPWSSNNLWGGFNYSLSLGALNLTSGNYSLWAKAYDKAGASTDWLEKAFSITQNNISFNSFNVFDAAGDSTNNVVFQGGAIRFNYGLSDMTSLSSVRLEAVKSGSIFNLGTWTGASLSNALINLNNFSNLTGGDYLFRAVARSTTGQDFFSNSQSVKILSWSQASNTTYGTFAADTLNYSGTLGTGTVVVGRGGTDTLNLSSIARANVTNINGVSLGSFNSLSSTNQAIFRGTAFDYLTLADGREIYFQGIENLRFSDNSTLELQVRTNDTHYKDQWNLRVSDVDSAWRFTQGSSNVLLVSLDTGVLSSNSLSTGDLSSSRLITNSSTDDAGDSDHGHQAVSIMSSTANNSYGVSGINWYSSVYVNDVYGGVNLQQAITNAINYARSRNQRVVFQGGIQGEYWFNNGGTRAQLEKLITDNSDIAIFAVAAGNGGIDIDNTNPNNTSVQGGLSGGVSRLQTTHSNVISVGALERTGNSTVNGLANSTSVNKASYSNFGSSLTLMAATDSPALQPNGNVNFKFNGTSAANPNMAGITSLVWSVNSNLNGGQLRQILIDTAMDLGTAGKDDTFGNGLVNADAAVRRALALSRNSQLASLYSGRSQFA